MADDTAGAGDQRLDSRFSEEYDDDVEFAPEEKGRPGEDLQGDIADGQDEDYAEDTTEYDFDEMTLAGDDENMIEVDSEEEDYDQDDEEYPEDRTDTVADNKELESLNKMLGTDFKTLEEARAKVNGTEETKEKLEDDNIEELPEEDIKRFEKNSQLIEYFQKQRKAPSRDKVFEDMKEKYRRANNNEFDEYAQQNIEDKIDRMEENGTLELNAENIDNKIDNAINKLSSDNNAITQKKQAIIEKQNNKLKSTLQGHFNDYYQKGFLGIKPDKEKVKQAYSNIVSGKIFKDIENDPNLVTKLAMFMEYESVLASKTNGPSYSDGVRDVASEIIGNKSDARSTRVRSTGVTNKSRDLKTRFLS